MKRFCFFIMFIFTLASIYSQTGANINSGTDNYSRTDNLRFKVAIYGPSDEIFIWWGHAALIVEDIRYNYSRVFDWGVFTYPSDNFLEDFLKDQVRYKCESSYFDSGQYITEDRDIAVYTLNLDRKAKETILAYAENNVLPDNSYYDYHEFRDNCSTRIRDILDLGTGGQFRAAFGSIPGRFSVRQHIRRYTWFRPVSDWFLGFLIGQDLDREITPWDEMFLPVEIARNITGFSYIDESGVKRRLVDSIEILNSSKNRPPILNEPLDTRPFTLILGIMAGAVILFIRILQNKFQRTGRILMGIIQSLLGLFLGGSGCVLFFGLFFLNNDYIQQNFNAMFMNPLLLAAVPLGIMTAINKPKKLNPQKILSVFWTCVFLAAVLSVLLWILPFFYQKNMDVLFMILPSVFALSCLPEKITGQLCIKKHQAVNP